MKSFNNFITEKKRSDYGRKGGQGGTQSTSSTPFDKKEARANMQDPSRAQTGGRKRKIGGPRRVLPSPEGITITNMPEPSRGTTDEVIARISSKKYKGFGDLPTSPETGSGGRTTSSSKPRGTTAKPGDLESFMRGEQRKGRSVSPTMQDVAGRKGAGYDFPQDAGTEKRKPTKPGSFVVDTDPKKGKSTGSLRKGNLKFSGDAKYKEMLAKLPDAKPTKPRTRTVKQAEVSKKAAEFRADYKTPKGEKAYQTAKSDITARKAFPTGKGGLKADEANPFVKRGVRQARADKLGGSVWDMPKGSNRPFKSPKPRDVSKITAMKQMKQSRQMGLPKIDWKASVKPPVPKTQIPKGAPPREATKQAVEFLKKSRDRTIVKQAVASIPKPKTIPTKTKPPSIGGTPMADKVVDVIRKSKSDEYRNYAQCGKGPKGEILDNAARKRYMKLAKTPFGIEKFVPDKPKATGGEIKPAKPTRQPRLRGTTKVKPLSTFAKFGKKVRGLGKFTGPAAAGLDLALSYSDERAKGSSKKRSLAKGVTKALGGALGGTLGAVGGGGLGSAALGVAGYAAGSELAGRAFDVAAGATKQQKATMAKMNRQSQKMQSVVKPNVSKSVTRTGDIVTRRTAVDPTKLAKTKVIRDKSGKERVGYLVKKGGTYGYKTGADPSTLAKTSSNPLERIGRTLFPGAYVQSDEAARKKRVAALKAKG